MTTGLGTCLVAQCCWLARRGSTSRTQSKPCRHSLILIPSLEMLAYLDLSINSRNHTKQRTLKQRTTVIRGSKKARRKGKGQVLRSTPVASSATRHGAAVFLYLLFTVVLGNAREVMKNERAHIYTQTTQGPKGTEPECHYPTNAVAMR